MKFLTALFIFFPNALLAAAQKQLDMGGAGAPEIPAGMAPVIILALLALVIFIRRQRKA